MPDVYTDYERKSGSRHWAWVVCAPIFGLVILYFVGINAFNSERHAIHMEQALSAGEHIVQTLTPVSAGGLEGRLVHLTGMPKILVDATDAATGVHEPALRLVRQVEMYQWVEHDDEHDEKRSDGSTYEVHTYRYTREWNSSLINSRFFKHESGHENPALMPLQAANFEAKAEVDGYAIPADLMRKLPTVASPGNRIYKGRNSLMPEIGDMRISYSVTPLQDLTLVAQKVRASFAPYAMPQGENIYLMKTGRIAPAAMFKFAKKENADYIWFERGVSFVLMAVAFWLVVSPIAEVLRLIPFVRTLFVMVCLPAVLFLSLVVNGVIIISSWIVFRPIVATITFAVMFVGALIIYRFASTMSRSSKYREEVAS